MPSKRPHAGFTLVELLIVIAVIAIIVAIALPNLLTARIAAQETSAITTVKQIIEAEVHFVAMRIADEDGSEQLDEELDDDDARDRASR